MAHALKLSWLLGFNLIYNRAIFHLNIKAQAVYFGRRENSLRPKFFYEVDIMTAELAEKSFLRLRWRT